MAQKEMFLTMDEACVMLRLTRGTLKNLALNGQVRGAYKFGNQWRFHRREMLSGNDGPSINKHEILAKHNKRERRKAKKREG